jgi:hypothetical protein
MLLESPMYGNLDPIRQNRCGLSWYGIQECETARSDIPERTKLAALSRIKERKLSMSYMLGDPNAKSIRKRCIRVEAIIIEIKPGVRSICVTKGSKKIGVSLNRSNKNALRSIGLTFGEESS